jgi:hypothetical protein
MTAPAGEGSTPAATTEPVIEWVPMVADRAGTGSELGWDPPVVMPAATRGRHLGGTVYYAALRDLGLVDAARACFRLPTRSSSGWRTRQRRGFGAGRPVSRAVGYGFRPQSAPTHPPGDRAAGHLPTRRAHHSGTPARASMSRPLNLEGSTSMRNCVYLTAADRRAPT